MRNLIVIKMKLVTSNRWLEIVFKVNEPAAGKPVAQTTGIVLTDSGELETKLMVDQMT